MNSLFQELKRRQVIKVAAVYAVVAWVLIQVADTILPALQLPDWTITFFTVFFMLGFPIAIVLAWAFELAPDRGSGDNLANAASPGTSNLDRKRIYATRSPVIKTGSDDGQICPCVSTDHWLSSRVGEAAKH